MNIYGNTFFPPNNPNPTVDAIYFYNDATADIGTAAKRAKTIYTQTLEATNVNTTNVNATGALDGAALFVTSGTIGTLTSTTANINTANLITATGTSLNFSTGTVGTLTSTTAGITTGNIATLNNTTGNITSGNIATLTSTNANITSATIGALTSTSIQADSVSSSGGIFGDYLIESNIVTTTADYTILITDRWILMTPGGTPASRTFTLPLLSAAGIGQKFTITDKNGTAALYTITVVPQAGDGTLNGAANFVMSTDYGSVTLQSNGSSWIVLEKL